MIGWGTEDGMDYWLCANSWGEKWGMKGYFKLDQNDQYSQMNVGVACLPNLSTESEAETFPY